MHLTKYPHPANFEYARGYDEASGLAIVGEGKVSVQTRSFAGGIRQLLVRDTARWLPDPHLAELFPPELGDPSGICLEDDMTVTVRDDRGRAVLRGRTGESFGVSGKAFLMQFEVPDDARFYGMGEKLFGRIELSGIRTRFWNTDVWSDFHWAQWGSHPSDPPYCSVPYVACKAGDAWVGVYVHNPGPVFMQTPGRDDTRVFVEWQRTPRNLVVGSSEGEPNVWFLVDSTLRGLTAKFQRLLGTTPLPPLWSLGFHQSRWGYGGERDLLELDRLFARHGIPCSGLWLDLDYMDGYRVFTVASEQFPNGARPVSDQLAKNGRRIVPILDPGVKKEPGYAVYEEGMAAGLFCRNEVGKPFVGLVWPGETVFPDFTQARVREWWARLVADLARQGFGAFWIDMNDPSTGPVEPEGMLFADGTQPHELHRNQFALGMQLATKAGLEAARPAERPFVLSRSGSAGTARHAAVWTGDNVSNHFYLRNSIPTSLGMSISGIPFNGPDIGGFGGDAHDELMVRWFQAGFLFPFCRNHTTADSRREEPWEYPAPARRAITRFIRLRYRLMPYLYNLFVQHEASGEPILRPLLYEFEEPGLEDLGDEFMIGPSLLQAPVLEPETNSRRVVLPGGDPWLCARTGRWRQPGRHTVTTSLATTPLYLRHGAVVPMLGFEPRSAESDWSRVAFLLAAPPGWVGKSEYSYAVDDGTTLEYRAGKRSVLVVRAEGDGKSVQASATMASDGFGPISAELWAPAGTGLEGPGKSIGRIRLTGSPWPVEKIFLRP